MIVDASALYAYFVRGAPDHWAVFGALDLAGPREELLVSPFSICELESMIVPKFGRSGWLAALEQLSSGAWAFPVVDADHLRALGPLVEGGLSTSVASVALLGETHDILSVRAEHQVQGSQGD